MRGGSAGEDLHYGVSLSSTEDVDNDGLASPRDRCPNSDVGLFPAANALTATSSGTDSDGDGIGDSCDPDPLTKDNCPGAAFAGKSAACVNAGANPAQYPTRASGCTTNANSNPAIGAA